MFQRRRSLRGIVRPTARATTRSTARVRWRAPDDLGKALTAFRRALRAHQRLARLAPRFFDVGVIERERRARADRDRWMALWEPALARTYGEHHQPYHPPEDRPPLPSPGTQRAVEKQLAAWQCWMAIGREARARHQQRHPHALPGFGRLARMLQIALDFAQLALGSDPGPEVPVELRDRAVWADLQRAYGQRGAPVSSAAEVPPAPPVAESPPAPAPVPAAPLAVGAPLPGWTTAVAPPRCDAYSRQARLLRTRTTGARGTPT